MTCAAPNLREDATNAYNPSDGDRADIAPAELLALHEKRGRRILSAAAANGAQALVLGAFGCGAFRNRPRHRRAGVCEHPPGVPAAFPRDQVRRLLQAPVDAKLR